MKNKRPLLSICIPTYNRADILEETILLLLSDPYFDSNEVEIIVSDNKSTDNTRQVVEKYPLIHYYCNKENVHDINFSYALQHGRGEYLKLLNDTVHFLPGGLKYLLDSIKENIQSKEPIFFYNKKINERQVVQCNSLGDFINTTSFYSTWIGNFGIWNCDLSIIKDIRLHSTMLLQVDWSYQIALKNPTKIYYYNYLSVKKVPIKNKTGYNIFQVFIENYLSFSKIYLKQNKISRWIYERNKFTLFYRFVAIRVIWLLVQSKNIIYFENSGSWRIILKNYGYYPYFYASIISGSLFYILKKFKLI